MNPLGPNQNNPLGDAALGADEPTQHIKGLSKESRHKRAEEEIRFQARLLDAVGEAVIASDPDGKIVYWNQAAEELYGWSAEEARGRSGIEVTLSEHLWERADEMAEMRAMRS